MICDFFQMVGDDDAIFDDRDLPQVQLQNDNVQAFDTKSIEVTSAFVHRPIDNILESLYKMQVEKSEELKHVLHVYTHETTFGDKKYDCCRLKLLAHRYPEQKIKETYFKARNRDEDRPAIGAPNKGKAEGKCKASAQKKLRERTWPGDGVPKEGLQQAVAVPVRVPNVRSVQTPYRREWRRREGEGRINVLPWYGPIDVVKTSRETHGG